MRARALHHLVILHLVATGSAFYVHAEEHAHHHRIHTGEFLKCVLPIVDQEHFTESRREWKAALDINSTSQNVEGCMRYVCATKEQCEDVHHTMAKRVMHVLECSRAVWMAVHGTLLGLVRNHSLSPNDVDMDVDLAVSKLLFKDIATGSSPVIHAIKAMGYHVFPESDPADTLIRVCLGRDFPGVQEDSADRNPYYDHYRYLDLYKVSEQRHEVVINGLEYPEEEIFPLRSIDLNGNTIPIPVLAEAVLTKLYGNWTVVRRTRHGSVLKAQLDAERSNNT